MAGGHVAAISSGEARAKGDVVLVMCGWTAPVISRRHWRAESTLEITGGRGAVVAAGEAAMMWQRVHAEHDEEGQAKAGHGGGEAR